MRTRNDIIKHAENGTIISILIEDLQVKYFNNEFNIILPNWLDYLEEEYIVKLKKIIAENGPNIIKEMYPNLNIISVEIQ